MSVFEFRDRVDTAIDKQMTALGETLINGRVSTMEDYRRLAGEVRGLDVAKGIIEAEYKRMFETKRVSDVKDTADETQD
jgi:hypothetical protein